MENLLDLFREATRGGLTIGCPAIKVGRATIQIVVKVLFAK